VTPELLWELAVDIALVPAILTARLLVRTRPYYRPLAWLLSADLAANLLGLALRRWAIAEHPRPYTGVARVAFHLEQACFLVWPAGLAIAACLVLLRPSLAGAVELPPDNPYTRARRWLHRWRLRSEHILAVAVGCIACRMFGYPEIRERTLAQVLLTEQVWLVAFLVAAAVMFFRRKDWWLPHHKTILALAVGEATVLLAGPYLGAILDEQDWPFRKHWMAAQVIYVLEFAALAVAQWRWRWVMQRSSD
jgi:hypothetical protein